MMNPPLDQDAQKDANAPTTAPEGCWLPRAPAQELLDLIERLGLSFLTSTRYAGGGEYVIGTAEQKAHGR